MYDNQADWHRAAALGVANYGQMTAGSYMYIGPQGIVHGTTITIMNAARKYLGMEPDEPLGGITFITSGLGGMSGAQAKAGVIAGTVNVIAEVNPNPLYKRLKQGWLTEVQTDLDSLGFEWLLDNTWQVAEKRGQGNLPPSAVELLSPADASAQKTVMTLDWSDASDPEGDPLEELLRYVRRKVGMSFEFPRESRLFANEIIQGAPRMGPHVPAMRSALASRACTGASSASPSSAATGPNAPRRASAACNARAASSMAGAVGSASIAMPERSMVQA